MVTSDDPDASARIARFAAGNDPWLVAVRMVSEGVDIPRLRVGVYATTTTTELFFRQAVGRFVRWTPGVPDQKAYLFILDDARLRARAFQIADQRRHSLAKRALDRPERDLAGFDTASRSRCRSSPPSPRWPPTTRPTRPRESATWTTTSTGPFDDDESLLVDLGLALPLAGDRRFLDDACLLGEDAATNARTRAQQKKRLRERNAEIVAVLVRRTGQTHPQINSELNRLSGIDRISEATVRQLEKRLEVAERLARG